MNYVFETEKWEGQFGLKPVNGAEFWGVPVCGPADLFNNWLLLEALVPRGRDERRLNRGTPMDVFVLAEGEPECRAVTKIGGLPYRPAEAKWPITESGRPMALIAQFNFLDSKDIVGSQLPGDLLLVFGDDEFGIEALHFEWQNVGIANVVESIPDSCMRILPCHGYRVRTESWPRATPLDSWRALELQGQPVKRIERVLCFDALQIGRSPFLVDAVCDRGDPWVHLCTIPSVQPLAERFPFLNREEPVSEYNISRTDYLTIFDAGCIYIYINLSTRELFSMVATT